MKKMPAVIRNTILQRSNEGCITDTKETPIEFPVAVKHPTIEFKGSLFFCTHISTNY
jgi:hypothetical protein